MISALELPLTLRTPAGPILLRRAEPGDLEALVALLADDAVSAGRGDVAAPEDLPAYRRALEAVIADTTNEIVVALESVDGGPDGGPDGAVDGGAIVATAQLTVIPGMARRGATRLLIEAVRVVSVRRSGGIGAAIMRWVAEEAAPATGATIVQLTSDAARQDAHRFYERLGYAASHVGFKLAIAPAE